MSNKNYYQVVMKYRYVTSPRLLNVYDVSENIERRVLNDVRGNTDQVMTSSKSLVEVKRNLN